MGLGPSTKMTTLHHYDCPITKLLLQDNDINFCGVVVNGVSEDYNDKVNNASKTALILKELNVNGVLVAIDGWGNHHIDFVSVIEQLGIRDITSVGLSYIGEQGKLVCTNEYVDTIIDFNKNSSGFESCIVGDNNLTYDDAYKALAILKNKLKNVNISSSNIEDAFSYQLQRHYLKVNDIIISEAYHYENNILEINKHTISKHLSKYQRIRKANLTLIKNISENPYLNSNLDFIPIATKTFDQLGSNDTYQLANVCLMLTGVEDKSNFQPSNIGSSQGHLKDVIKFNQAGTPKENDFIIHLDILFEENEARTTEGIIEAHMLADDILNEIRHLIKKTVYKKEYQVVKKECYQHIHHHHKPKIALVKLVSGLGNMYDTSINTSIPCSLQDGIQIRDRSNHPYLYRNALYILDGVIHSLL